MLSRILEIARYARYNSRIHSESQVIRRSRDVLYETASSVHGISGFVLFSGLSFLHLFLLRGAQQRSCEWKNHGEGRPVFP
jgi:hypothetical protein